MVHAPSPEHGPDGKGHVPQLGVSAKLNGLLQALGEARTRLGVNTPDPLQRVIAAAKDTRKQVNAASKVPGNEVLSPLLASIQQLADAVEGAIQEDSIAAEPFDALLAQVEQALANLRAAYHLDQ